MQIRHCRCVGESRQARHGSRFQSPRLLPSADDLPILAGHMQGRISSTIHLPAPQPLTGHAAFYPRDSNDFSRRRTNTGTCRGNMAQHAMQLSCGSACLPEELDANMMLIQWPTVDQENGLLSSRRSPCMYKWRQRSNKLGLYSGLLRTRPSR